MHKILFLDVDGVFTSKRVHVATGGGMSLHWNGWDPVAVKFINDNFGPNTGWKVVISSTWGKTFDFTSMCDIMGAAGLRLDLHEEWNTPTIGHYQRGEEIQKWLTDNDMDCMQSKHYIIVDDNDDMLATQQDNFVKTSTDDGILSSNYSKLISLKNIIDNAHQEEYIN